MVGNLFVTGIAYGLVFAFFTSSLYLGANLPLTVLFTLAPVMIWSLVYYMLTVAMPRTGGDYVWVSRAIHPLLGFVGNYFYTIGLITTNAVVAAWIVVYGLQPMIAGLGIVYSSQGLISAASEIAALPTSFLISIVILSVFMILLFFSTRSIFRAMWVIYAIIMVSVVAMIASFFLAPPSVFSANFDRLSGMNYSDVISTAGLPTGFTLGATLTGSIFTVTNLAGFNASAYFASEVRQAKVSQFIAIIGSALFSSLILGLIYASAYYSMGSSFLSSVSFLAASGNSKYVLPAAPVLNFLAVFANPNPIVIVLSSLALIATSVGSLIAFTFTATRSVFAWSFDRLLPSWLANVDQKRGSPYAAVILLWILSTIFTVVYYYTPFFTYYIYSSVLLITTFGIASLGAALFPFSRRTKSAFDTAPAFVRKKLGSVPLVSIIGVIGFLFAAYLDYGSFLPSVTPPPSGSPLVQFTAYVIVPLIAISAIIIYFVSYYYRRSKGIDLRLGFEEIPPE